MDDRSVRVLEALVAHLPELPALVGAGWESVRPKLLAIVEAWLRGDDDPSTLASEVLSALRRFPEARDLVDPPLRAMPPAAALESFSPRSPSKHPGDLHIRAVSSAPPEPRRARRGAERLVESLRDALTDPASVHLNAWFPECRDDDSLVVGEAARLCVNLGPRSDAGASVAASKLEQLDEVDHVDVVVHCPDAKITPASQRLELPPRADHVVEFALTPLCAGTLRIAVVLLVQNDPVERLEFEATALQGDAP